MSPIGETLKQTTAKYAAKFDEKTSMWTIINLWDDSLSNLDVDSDIPDDSPALTAIPEDALLVLLEEAKRLQLIDKYTQKVGVTETHNVVNEQTTLSHSPDTGFRKYVVDALMRLAAMGEVTKL